MKFVARVLLAVAVVLALASTAMSQSATATVASASGSPTAVPTAPANISWYAPLRGATLVLSNGQPYVVEFTPNSEITFESIDLYEGCDGVRGDLVLHLGALDVSSGRFQISINISLSSTTLYCFEMSDTYFWYNSPPFYAITSQVSSSPGTGSSTSYSSPPPISSSNNLANGTVSGSTSSSSSSGLPAGAIGGIVAGGAVVLAAAFFTGWFIRRKKPTPPAEPTPYPNGQASFQPTPGPDVGYPYPYANVPAPTAAWPPPAQDPNYYINYAPVPAPPPVPPQSQKSQGGMYSNPLSPSELENLYGKQSTPPAGQPLSPTTGYAPSPPPPFHTVLKPYDPEPTATQVKEEGSHNPPDAST